MNGLKTVAQIETVSVSLSMNPSSSVLTLSFLVNWRLYAELVQVCITLFNTMSVLVQSLLEVRGEQDPLPAFDYPQFEDSEYVPIYFVPVSQSFLMTRTTKGRLLITSTNGSHIGFPKTMREWSQWICNHIETLDKVCGLTQFFLSNVRAQYIPFIEKIIDFPSRIFIEHLFEITQTRFQGLHSKISTHSQLVVPTSSITSSVDSFKTAMQHQHMKLLQTLNFSVRRSPKRRLDSVAPSEQGR